ncbi:hypothetical protein HKBW3S03_00602, partial [Candidatus Hakubella thermalkaliphila]
MPSDIKMEEEQLSRQYLLNEETKEKLKAIDRVD